MSLQTRRQNAAQMPKFVPKWTRLTPSGSSHRETEDRWMRLLMLNRASEGLPNSPGKVASGRPLLSTNLNKFRQYEHFGWIFFLRLFQFSILIHVMNNRARRVDRCYCVCLASDRSVAVHCHKSVEFRPVF